MGLHVKYRVLLADCNEICILSTDFRRILKITVFMKIHPVGAELFRADGRTDVTKLRAAFSEFF
jgi:hypothetical protein